VFFNLVYEIGGIAMARLGKRERAEKRARDERNRTVHYVNGVDQGSTRKIGCSHDNFTSKATRAYVSQVRLINEKPMYMFQRDYRDYEKGLTEQKSFG